MQFVFGITCILNFIMYAVSFEIKAMPLTITRLHEHFSTMFNYEAKKHVTMHNAFVINVFKIIRIRDSDQPNDDLIPG